MVIVPPWGTTTSIVTPGMRNIGAGEEPVKNLATTGPGVLAYFLTVSKVWRIRADECDGMHDTRGLTTDRLVPVADLSTETPDRFRVAPPSGPVRPDRMRRRLRGKPGTPAWERPALVTLLGATAVLYIWGLGASGWANSYYSAAAQAGAKSWKAFFFGSLDAGNSITVDKSPGFLWVMGISARIFGVNAWSILVPQALEGVAAVGVLYATVRRWFSPAAALVAGAVLATTPVATLMFRFNNPDALLVLLLVGAAYALTRALEHGSTCWVALAFSLVGFGFLAKMLQSLIVLPAFGLVYLFAGPPRLGRRVWQLFLGGFAMLASAGWWIVAVELWPASSRPYIGGSQNNSLWNLMFGYNGFGRLTGNENGSVGGGAAGTAGRWGPTGWTRMFNSDFGAQISWLLPAALVLLAAGLVVTGRRARTDRTRAALMLWGGWLLVTGLMFSLGKGIIHPYYSVALAPAVGAVVGIGAATLWSHRTAFAQCALVAAFAAAVLWSYNLLARTPSWNPWLRVAVAVGGFVVLAGLLALRFLRHRGALAVGLGAVVVGLLGPGAYSIATAATAHMGAIPSAGPAVASGRGRAGFGAGRFPAGGQFRGGQLPGQGFGQFPSPPVNGVPAFGGAPGGGLGGLLNGTTVSAATEAMLRNGAMGYRWAAATVDANNAASYQLASGASVMAIGGFNGTDPSPTLAQFQHDVANREIHYFIAGGRGGGRFGPGGASTSSAITSWVESNFTARTVGGVTVYDLTASVQ